MLDSLTNLSLAPERKKRLLSEVSRRFLPNPGIDSQDFQFDDFVKEDIITEIRTKLGITPGDWSPPARTRILEFLTNEMAESVLGNANLIEVKERTAKLDL